MRVIIHLSCYYILTLIQEEIKRISQELALSEKCVENAYKAYWTFIKETIGQLPLKEELTEEEFGKLRTNFNIPNLGKLSCTYKRWLGVKKHYNKE